MRLAAEATRNVIRRAAALGVVLALAVPLSAHAARGERTIRVTGHLHAVTDTVTDRTLCPVGAPLLSDIVFYSGTSTFTGVFTGTGKFCGWTSPLPGVVTTDGRVPFHEVNVFTGTVKGCGTGAVTYKVSGTVGGTPSASPPGIPAREDWRIVARSGRAGLVGLSSGSGHDEGFINADGSIDVDFTGSVTCKPSR